MEHQPENTKRFSFTSHETALCVIPPRRQWQHVDRLRSLYDKAYGAWPPHVNLIYPFVQPELLDDAAHILSKLQLQQHCHQVKLEAADAFVHKSHNTIFLCQADNSETDRLSRLRDDICNALQSSGKGGAFRPHMTIGQSQDSLAAPHYFLLEKARLLAPLNWQLVEIAILVRDVASSHGEGPRPMRQWATLHLDSQSLRIYKSPELFYEEPTSVCKPVAQHTFRYSDDSELWEPASSSSTVAGEQLVLDRLIAASYNVLAEFEWPPQSGRYPGLIDNILSNRANADILVLQEVTDHFLPHLLANNEVRQRYPFTTYAPPDQPGIGPLPSLLNLVILSKFPFIWEHVPFQRKHKGCAVVQFSTIGTRDVHNFFHPWVLVACHLSQGLTDGAVATKKGEIQRMLDHLSKTYPEYPCILAGDFNLSTSSYTVDAARKKQDISSATVQYLRHIDHLMTEAGFSDAWLTTRLESGESSDVMNEYRSVADAYEGEQGATFDPLTNNLASKLVGTGLNNRPQRYDRILVRANNQYRPQGFNMFGQATMGLLEGGKEAFASDHWGIRCLLARCSAEGDASQTVKMHVQRKQAPLSFSSVEDLKQVLERHGSMPTESDTAARRDALQLLQKILLDLDRANSESDARSGLIIRLVPVGSYGLGVWTSASDIDCLCIGSISSKTFFSLAIQRIRKAAASERIKILRRVMANTGYMLELEVHGIKVDLQYCAATGVAESWPDVMKRPSTDPSFALPFQVLGKLKPARDMFYLRRSVPDMGQYRIAHLFIKAWAKARGIYSSKFGFLGGIHISVMLVPICKLLAIEGEAVSSSDILTTFFHHYAGTDWESAVVFDPFFHKGLRYNRSFREPLCLLGWHAPSLNTAFTASVPTIRVISAEFKRVQDLLETGGMTWDGLLGFDMASKSHQLSNSGATEFLRSYRSYVKIDAHYWGSSPEKGSRFIGWLESRCVMLLVELDRKIKNIGARIWPARFADGSSAAMNHTGAEFHGCYLVGLEWDGDEELTKEQVKSAQNSLQTVLQEFEAKIRRDEKYFDSKSSWMTVTVVRGRDLGDLELDQSCWGEDAGEDEGDSEDDMDVEDEFDDVEGDTDEASGRADRKTIVLPSRAAKVAKAPGLGKFRSAGDVLNRLRWDGNMDSSDYVVGYEDRFIGAQEKAVEQWKSEQTDEEFIPQHRILYFKRKSDGAIVWERRSRIDDIFGSGIKRNSPDG